MQTSLVGPLFIAEQDINTSSTTQKHALGQYAETLDGRGFRYCKVGSGAATVAGKVYQSRPLDATNEQPSGGLGVLAAAIGDLTVTLSSSVTLAADLLAGGYLSVNASTGAGNLYRIKSNTAVTAATGCVITLEDPIRVALTTSSKVIVAAHPYNGVVIEPGTPTGVIAGVATSVIAASSFGWLQTKGACSVLFTGTGVAGKAVGSLSGGTSGSSAPAIAATNILGYQMATGITGEYALVNLTIG